MLDFYRQLGSYINQGFVIFTENDLTHTMNRIGLTKRAGNAKLNLDAVQLTEVELPTGSTVIEADRLGIALDTCGLFLYQDIDHKGDCKK